MSIAEENNERFEEAVKKALDIMNKDAKDDGSKDSINIVKSIVEATVKAYLHGAENLEIADLKKQNEKLKAKNKRLCNELIEYKMVQNALETADADDCFDEDDFFNL